MVIDRRRANTITAAASSTMISLASQKRMQYNRRFVTAVVGFGKKRGPNSSEK